MNTGIPSIIRSLAVACLFLAGIATAQRIATYDPTAAAELALVNLNYCAPHPAVVVAVPGPAPAAYMPGEGDLAADNVNRRWFYSTGVAGDPILRIPFNGGGGAMAFIPPAGFARVTGLEMEDPAAAPAGNQIWMTDGTVLRLCALPAGGGAVAILAGAAAPMGLPAGNYLTGLARDPLGIHGGWPNQMWAMDNQAQLYGFNTVAAAWTGAIIAPAFGVAAEATGLVFERCPGGTLWVCYRNGQLRSPIIGAFLPFPARPHRGMAFAGLEWNLGGAGGVIPALEITGTPSVPSLTFGLNAAAGAGGNLWMLVDVPPPAFGAAPTVMLGGLGNFWLDPATFIPLTPLPVAGPLAVPIPLPAGFPLCQCVRIQVAEFDPVTLALLGLSDALEISTFAL